MSHITTTIINPGKEVNLGGPNSKFLMLVTALVQLFRLKA